MSYPLHDEQFEDAHIASASKDGDGWLIQRSDGWSIYIPGDSPVEPSAGMSARFYGKGIGYPVRGIFLAGAKVFYRTEEEEKDHHEIQTYGADAADWLKRWDNGNTCWTIEMGGLGPGYEQCIHITCAEILRHMLAKQYDASKWTDADAWKHDEDEIDAMSHENTTIKALGLSGAQWGAALNLAAHFYQDGPRTVMTNESIKDRHIQVSRTFPQVEQAA